MGLVMLKGAILAEIVYELIKGPALPRKGLERCQLILCVVMRGLAVEYLATLKVLQKTWGYLLALNHHHLNLI